MLIKITKKIASTKMGRDLIIFFMSVFRIIGSFSIFNIAYYFDQLEGSNDFGSVTKVYRKGISGIAFGLNKDRPLKVELLVDGVVINTTYAAQKIYYPLKYYGEFIGFYFPMTKIWNHIEKNQKIEILADGKLISYRAGKFNRKLIPNYGILPKEKIDSIQSITNRVEQGWIINKFGRVQIPRNTNVDWSKNVLSSFSQINKIFKEKYNKQIFVFYGGLLGFARDGEIIAHDCDFDLAYFSEETDPNKVRFEFYRIAEYLANEYREKMSFSDNKINFIKMRQSITPVWINSNGEFSCTFAYVGDNFRVVNGDIIPIKSVEYNGYKLNLPANPENIVKYIYGRGWKYPDPGWKWLLEYKIRTPIFRARLSSSQVKKLNKIASGK